MSDSILQTPTLRRLAITVRGVVQGVGFRPFLYNAARARKLTGWVRNEADTVQIEVQGEPASLDAFVEAIRRDHPPQARIESVEVCEAACQPGEGTEFEIRHSAGGATPRPTIPADLATCPECLTEVRDPTQRRRGYPFTNCTNCGPRWSIIEQLPYDRPRTSMRRFALCPECTAEYENPADRRFHAQPIACPRCGPVLRLLDANGRELAKGEDALAQAVAALLDVRIVALKGLGGFQLLVDATDAAAVARLRNRKRRPDRPFAVMLPSMEEVRRYCEVSEREAEVLTSHQAPIVLLRRQGESDGVGQRSDHGGLPSSQPSPARGRVGVVEEIAPGNPYLGVMLPYTPLHHLLMAAVGRPLICTSGNLSEEPMAIATADALNRLGAIADLVLTHDRPIVRPVDDSIVRLGPVGHQVLRRARGYAPLPIEIGFPTPTILALGGHLKNTVALALGCPLERGEVTAAGRKGTVPFSLRENRDSPQGEPEAPSGEPEAPSGEPEASASGPCHRPTHAGHWPTPVVLSPHIGDLDNVLSVEVHRRAIRDLVGFFEAVPEAIACDLHPDYASTREAEALAMEWGVPLVRVQHHHAHVAACMAEHRLEGPVLGLAWDGTGYGPDGTIWGGEALVCQRAEYRRAAHLRTFALPGGDRAVREPRRSALGLLYEILGEQAGWHVADWFAESELPLLLSMLARRLHAPRTSSMGRLFDAVAAVCGLPAVISFEGQAAMALEFAADWSEPDAYPLPLRAGSPAVADWEPLVRAVLADRLAGVPIARISARMHNALAEMAVAVAQASGCSRVCLSGGCFQNALLTHRVHARLSRAGFSVYIHHQVPPGDGGIALGQVWVAAQTVQR